jgi:hypothetical protein
MGDLPAADQAWREALAILDDLGHLDGGTLRTKLKLRSPPSDGSLVVSAGVSQHLPVTRQGRFRHTGEDAAAALLVVLGERPADLHAQSRLASRSGLALALLALAQLVYSLDLNIVFVALPRIGAALGFSGQTEQRVVSAYVVFRRRFMRPGGRISDLFGRRRAFVGALVLYALSSLAGGLGPDQAVIIVTRAVQGVGGALLLPATLGLVTTLFEEGPPRNRALVV